jgi:succinate dehydrogenase / fumarate reductase flavoprotein subunit
MGNSVLDCNVFGGRAGKYAAEYPKSANIGKLTLQHITDYENELKRAKIKTDLVALVLLLLILQKTCASASSLPTTRAP